MQNLNAMKAHSYYRMFLSQNKQFLPFSCRRNRRQFLLAANTYLYQFKK